TSQTATHDERVDVLRLVVAGPEAHVLEPEGAVQRDRGLVRHGDLEPHLARAHGARLRHAVLHEGAPHAPAPARGRHGDVHEVEGVAVEAVDGPADELAVDLGAAIALVAVAEVLADERGRPRPRAEDLLLLGGDPVEVALGEVAQAHAQHLPGVHALTPWTSGRRRYSGSVGRSSPRARAASATATSTAGSGSASVAPGNASGYSSAPRPTTSPRTGTSAAEPTSGPPTRTPSRYLAQ